LYKNRNLNGVPDANAFDSQDGSLAFNVNRPPFFRPRGRNEFEKVRKVDVIENLEIPKLDGQEEIIEEPLKEFEYVPPTYLENRDPPYNVTLLTLPKEDVLVKQEPVEQVPVYTGDPRYNKFRPSRLNAFGSELFYLQSQKEIERQIQRELSGGR
jgi:hypothetical protein